MDDPADRRPSRIDELDARLRDQHDWVAPLVGRTCSRVTIDQWSPPLVLWFLLDEPVSRLEIDAPIRLTIEGQHHVVDPAVASSMGPVLQMIGRTVTGATNGPEGDLRLEFGTDAMLEVDAAGASAEDWWFAEEAPSPSQGT